MLSLSQINTQMLKNFHFSPYVKSVMSAYKVLSDFKASKKLNFDMTMKLVYVAMSPVINLYTHGKTTAPLSTSLGHDSHLFDNGLKGVG